MTAEQDTRRLSAASLAAGDPTGWFETLYAEAQAGAAQVPWDRPRATPLLVDWARRAAPDGSGRSALVVGCGLGRDAEFVAGLGFATTAFDISATAVRVARERHPDSPVTYVVADLLDPPASWRRRFDLVVESNNVQALPRELRDRATAAVAALVAPGGTLVVLGAVAGAGDADDGPPWPLDRAEVEAFAGDRLSVVSVEQIPAPDDPAALRWRAVFRAAAAR
jgi:SAM-dependent methyltransferase